MGSEKYHIWKLYPHLVIKTENILKKNTVKMIFLILCASLRFIILFQGNNAQSNAFNMLGWFGLFGNYH